MMMSQFHAIFSILTAILVCTSPTRSSAVGAVGEEQKQDSSNMLPLSTAFLNACTDGRLDEIEAALKEHPDWVHGRSESGETCLHVAGIKGQVEVSRLILKMGGDVNVRSTFAHGLRMHPLAWNVYGGHVENVRVLLEEGNADVNLDYDDAKGSPITVLDTVLDIAPDEKMDKPGLERFYMVKELLLKHGAKQYKDLQNEGNEL
jgi:hypothetical protein